MKNLPKFHYYHNPKSEVLDIILQGSNVSIDSLFLQKVFNVSKEIENSVIAFNFPYFDQGRENSSGEDLHEETDTLQKILEFGKYKDYRKVRFIGKSLGGIVGSYYLDKISKSDQKQFEIILLGYVRGSIRLNNFGGKIIVIQGEKDKFGNIEKVKEDLKECISKDIIYHQIDGADHSYRNPETKEPLYEDAVMRILLGYHDE